MHKPRFSVEKIYSKGNFSIQYFELFSFPETALDAQTASLGFVLCIIHMSVTLQLS